MPGPLTLLAHPVYAAHAAAAWCAAQPVPTAVAQTWRRLWREALPLDRAAARTPVRVGGAMRHAVVLAAPGRWQVTGAAPGEGRLRAWCVVRPSAWAVAGGSRVRLEVRDERGTRARELVLAPARRWRDRRWRALVLPAAGAFEAALTVDGPRGVEVALGDVEVSWPRPAAGRGALVRAFAARLRAGGLRDVWRWARDGTDREAAVREYRRWCEARTPSPTMLAALREAATRHPAPVRFSVLTPVHDTPPAWLEACVASVLAQAWPHWELVLADDGSTRADTRAVLARHAAHPQVRVVRRQVPGGISAATNAALAVATGDYVALLDHDDLLAPHALARMAEALDGDPQLDVVYSDEDKLDADGTRVDPYFKPDWCPDLLTCSMYVCHFLVARRRLVAAVGGFRSAYDGSQDHDLVLRLVDGGARVGHVADVLYHWRKVPQSAAASGTAKPWAHEAGRRALQDHVSRRGMDAVAEDGGAPGVYRLRYRIAGTPRVSAILPVGDGEVSTAAALLDALRAASWPLHEVVLAGPGAQALAARAGRDVRVADGERAGGPGAWRAAAVAAATGDYLLVLDSHVRPRHRDWIEALLEHAQRPGIGAVGARLFHADGRLRHVGLATAGGGRVCRPADGWPGASAGYFGAAWAVRTCTAVAGQCLLAPRAAVAAAGGWHPALAGDALDLDFGLRLAAAGLRSVYTPHARLTDLGPPRTATEAGAVALRERWGAQLDGDRYYNWRFVAGVPGDGEHAAAPA